MKNAVSKSLALLSNSGKPAALLKELTTKLGAEVSKLREQGSPERHIQLVLQAAIPAITREIENAKKEQIQNLEGLISSAEKAYKLDQRSRQGESAADVAKYRDRIAGMTESEIIAEAQNVNPNALHNPQMMDILSASLKTIDPARHEVFRKSLVQSHYDSPWLKMPEVNTSYQDLQFIQKLAPGTVLVKSEDGKRAAVDYAQLTGLLEASNG